MPASYRTAAACALLWCWISPLVNARREVLSTVIYTNHGDRKPLILDDYHILSPLGVRQMYAAGARIRSQYIAPAPNATNALSQTWELQPDFLDYEALSILATNDPYTAASAQAFMQALYPPLASNGTWEYIDSSFLQGDGNVTQPLLNGLQYPTVMLTRDRDVSSMYLKGARNCPSFYNRIAEYANTTEYAVIQASSQAFYDQLLADGFIHGFPTGVVIGYANAWYIWDYLNYEYTHNSTVAETLSPTTLTLARVYASDWVFAMYANSSDTGEIGDDPLDAIAGRTLATSILRFFAEAVRTEGRTNKVNLLFGDYQPMVSFAGLAGLVVPQHSSFYNLPAPGASYIFELFAFVADTDNSTDWPAAADMFVRFLYTNATDDSVSTVEYPLFGASPSQSMMRLSDFVVSMAGIQIQNTSSWCTTCSSPSTFCVAANALDPLPLSGHHGLSPAVAGVIGALVALVFALLVLSVAMLIGGIRLYRVPMKRRSELGGFKGAEKLASDEDLTLPKGGAGATVIESEREAPRGHERVGSWELREQARQKEIAAGNTGLSTHDHTTRRPSYEDDEIHINPFSDPVRPRDSL